MRELAPLDPDIQKKISQPPVFDVDRVVSVLKIVESQGYKLEALNLSLALILYNYSLSECFTEVNNEYILGRNLRLVEREIEASDPNNPLPTIGFEVESPRKPYSESLGRKYAEFFDAIGMPRNKANVKKGEMNNLAAFWEFSPPPSYTSSTQPGY